jgi:type I restriction enzyme S subunit
MKHWPTKQLGEVLEVGRERIEPTEHPDTLFNFIGLESIESHTGKLLVYQPKPGADIKSTKNVFQTGQILYGKLRPYLNKVHLARKDGICSTDIYVLQPCQQRIHSPFVAYYLRSPEVLAMVSNAMAGANLPRISQEGLLSISVPVPPLAEQERLVKLLDEADQLRQLRAQADVRTAALTPALFHEIFGDVATNPKGWPMKPFGELATNQDGRRKPVKASDRAERRGKYPYYGASGIIDYVEEYLFDEAALLIGEDGANLLARSTPIAFLAQGKYWVNNHAHVVTDNGKADLNYLCVALNLRDLTGYVTGSAQPKLNQANMNRMQIPVPPLPLQKQFAARATEIRAVQAEQAASRKRLDNLFQSMLHRAFNGEL